MPLHGANRQRPTNRKGVDMNKVSGIYRIELGNGYFYIGSAFDLGRRKSQHYRSLNRNGHENSKMQNCWNKYGVFVFTVLEECDISELLLREQLLIDKHFSNRKNVNLNPCATSQKGAKRSQQSKQRMSIAAKSRQPMTCESRKKQGESFKQNPNFHKNMERLHNSNIGRIPSIEHRKKISEALKGRVRSPEHSANISAAWARRRAS